MTDDEKVRQARNDYTREYMRQNPGKRKIYQDRWLLKKFESQQSKQNEKIDAYAVGEM